MRQLILMRGSIGSGKSTWIKEQGLADYTLSADKLRVMLGNYAKTDINGNLVYQQQDEAYIWSLLFKMLESRMSKGQLTLVDAQHATRKSINAYKELAHKYNYMVYVVTMPLLPLEELKQRVNHRNYNLGSQENSKYIKESVVEASYYKLKRADSVPRFARELTSQSAPKVIGIQPMNLSDYSGLVVFGDIHSSYRVLKEAWEDLAIDQKLADNYLVVCVGDLFDRGIRPVETFKFLEEKKDKYKNFVLLMGNHDFNLYNEVFETRITPPSHTHKDTTAPLHRAGITNKRLRRFLRKFNDSLFLDDKGILYNITHGGIVVNEPCLNLSDSHYLKTADPYYFSKIPALEMIYGSGKFADGIDDFASTLENTITIHGHRNVHHTTTMTALAGLSINLEQGVDEGRNLAVVYTDNDFNLVPKLYKNVEFNISEHLRKQMVQSGTKTLLEEPKTFLKYAQESKYTNLKAVAPNVVSVNFSREAFYKDIWDSITIKARGLFINTQTNKVVARGYNKFFRAGEQDTWKEINAHAPFVVYRKYNGFLGLLTYDKDQDKFLVCSKSQIAGTSKQAGYAELAESVITEYLGDNLQDLKEELADRTAIFEVVDETKDPHIVHNFDKPTAILLDVVNNNLSDDFVANHYKYATLAKFAEKYGFKVKELVGTVAEGKDARTEVERIIDEDHLENEGYVLESLKDGYQTKAKTYLYTANKYARSLYNKARRKQMTGDKFRSYKNSIPYDSTYIVGQRKKTIERYQALLEALATELDQDKSEQLTNILEVRKEYGLIIK